MARLKPLAAAGMVIVLVAGCSSAKNKSTQRPSLPPTAHTTAASASTPETSSPASSSPSAAGLSGTWNGKYSGSYTGTFTLTWTQSASELTGTITLSSPSGTLPIQGTVSNGQITFGTLGSTPITYTGSSSGNAMSGRYQVAGGAGGTGTWNAAKK